MICGAPIWVAGSAITGDVYVLHLHEADDSEDYEIR